MEQESLFRREVDLPLAARMRPKSLADYVGQQHLVGKGKMLRKLIAEDKIFSMIFWGPPGVGKTTLARIIARETKARFIDFSAVTSGIKEIRTVMQEAEKCGYKLGLAIFYDVPLWTQDLLALPRIPIPARQPMWEFKLKVSRIHLIFIWLRQLERRFKKTFRK